MSDNLEQDSIGFSPNPKIPSPSEIQIGPAPDDCHYDMKHFKRGSAIIFNHMYFNMQNCPTRHGTNKDRDDLKELFSKLKFDVKCYNDLGKEQVKEVLASVAVDDHSEEDCLVVVVLSHGDNRKIYAKDTYYPTDLLWMFLDGRHSPTLVGKPKLLFIQACRGEDVERPVLLKSHTEVDAHSSPKQDFVVYSIPAMADILVMYSTMLDYLSWRNPSSGSYFIQSLIRQLSAHYKSKDLLSILTYVNREVAIGSSPEMREKGIMSYGHKQMCSIVSMLTREVHFD